MYQEHSTLFISMRKGSSSPNFPYSGLGEQQYLQLGPVFTEKSQTQTKVR